MKLNYNPDGWQISAEQIVVPSSAPYIVRPAHDNFMQGTVEIWQNSDKSGNTLTEEEWDGSPASGCFQVDYAGNVDFRKSAIAFNEAQAGTSWYIWYKTLGDVIEADDINDLDAKIEAVGEELVDHTYDTEIHRRIYISESEPSSGSEGDIWIQISE